MKNKIDITKWKDFKICEIFITSNVGNKKQVPTGASVAKKDLEENGCIPRISVTGTNNGIVGYYDCKSDDKSCYRVYNNFISVSFLGTIFYQEGECSLDMKVHCLKPINKILNKYIALYLVSALRASLIESSYSDQISSTVLPELTIKLPIDIQGNPNWSYMEQYMRNIEKKVLESVKFLSRSSNQSNKMDISEWKPFHLYDIFYIDSGTKMDKVAMKFNNPTIDFVGRSGINNGVTAIVDEVDGYKPYKAGNLTLALGGAYLGSCFVQEKSFYTSQNVIVLIPKCKMSMNVKQFICSVIFKEGNMHYKAFNDELNRHIKTDFTIMLPINKVTGEPDYEYMDKYMEQIKNRVINKYNILKNN